jgi:hypothetical protein
MNWLKLAWQTQSHASDDEFSVNLVTMLPGFSNEPGQGT